MSIFKLEVVTFLCEFLVNLKFHARIPCKIAICDGIKKKCNKICKSTEEEIFLWKIISRVKMSQMIENWALVDRFIQKLIENFVGYSEKRNTW